MPGTVKWAGENVMNKTQAPFLRSFYYRPQAAVRGQRKGTDHTGRFESEKVSEGEGLLEEAK